MKYRVRLSQPVWEEVEVEVDAETESEAERNAILYALSNTLDWEPTGAADEIEAEVICGGD